ncbi:MAG: YdeI/OmpD-associated family protein [Thermoleophilaceae bacterium]|nr:YdeI/OmpD-associated family protein [Thermoleophilaceae bacterium]
MTGRPRFFATPEEFRAWLERNHESASELLVGFHKKGSGRPSITWPEAVEQALCFGWIDGVRRRLDDESYTIRFTPRKPSSTWSRVNLEKVEELKRRGLMRPAGLRAYEQRREEKTGIYSYEQREAAELPAEYEERLRANAAAWQYWSARPPSYRKAATWWIVSAKREETRDRRLAQLLEHSEKGRTVPPLTPPKSRTA